MPWLLSTLHSVTLKGCLYQKRYYHCIEICSLPTHELTSRPPKIHRNFPRILPGTTFSFVRLFLLIKSCKDQSPGMTATADTVRAERGESDHLSKQHHLWCCLKVARRLKVTKTVILNFCLTFQDLRVSSRCADVCVPALRYTKD